MMDGKRDTVECTEQVQALTINDEYDARPKVELLAPAGDMTCLHAAVCAGADAVYLGLGEFNARRNADNFTLKTLKEACDYAHLRGVRVYVTLNIALLPSELSRALAFARDAYLAGADALIVQDIGLAAEISRSLPQVRLHASTQMNTHNACGIEAAARLGVSQITLARELSVAEISHLAQIAHAQGLAIEVFAHGALCVCYSGQCLMSSLIGGRSANRGLCAQPCRLPYSLHVDDQKEALSAPGKHLLSPKDLCTIDVLGSLVKAGVTSLKIEGRMKSPDYVFAVTRVYRAVLNRVLDAHLAGNEVTDIRATDEERTRLADAFSRGFTTAYLFGNRGNEMMSYGRPNNRGVFVGRVARIQGERVEIDCEKTLYPKDVLEFWTNRGHFAHELDQIDTTKSGRISVRLPKRVGKGDRVFRVRSAADQFRDEPFNPRVAVRGKVRIRRGQPAEVSFVLACEQTTQRGSSVDVTRTSSQSVLCGKAAAVLCGKATGKPVEAARTKVLTEEEVRTHIGRTRQTPYVISELKIDLEDGCGMGFSTLHRLRRDALDDLTEQILDPYWRRSAPQIKPCIPIVVQQTQTATVNEANEKESKKEPNRAVQHTKAVQHSKAVQHTNKPLEDLSICAWATNPACARAAKRAGADVIYVPALNYRRGQATYGGARQEELEQAGYPKQCVIALPTIDHDLVTDMNTLDAAPTNTLDATPTKAEGFDPWDYVRPGKRVFVDNLAALMRALDQGAEVEVGPHVPALNASTCAVLGSWGAKRLWLSPELTLAQIADLAEQSPVELGLTISGAQELMITEHCLLMSQGPCDQQCETCVRRTRKHHYVDRRDFTFPLITDMLGRSHLYNGIELDTVCRLSDFIDLGIAAVMVDTTLLDQKKAFEAVDRVVYARSQANKAGCEVKRRPHTTTGHLFRGVI